MGQWKRPWQRLQNLRGCCDLQAVVFLFVSFLYIHLWSYGAEISPLRTQNEFSRQSSKLSSALIIVGSLSVVLSLLYILPLTPPIESTEGSDLFGFQNHIPSRMKSLIVCATQQCAKFALTAGQHVLIVGRVLLK